MEPINVTREEFPKSTAFVPGMKIISPKSDNYELIYEYDVPYRKVDDRTLYLQLIKPINPERKVPAIVFIPGSAFHRQNVKERVAQLALLATKGYMVALLEYTGSEDGVFPQFILDAKAGIAFVKKNADKYNIDSRKVFVMGDSSGAYTALMAGLTNGVKELEDEVSKEEDYSVAGIIDFYGPTDITTMNDVPSSQDHRTADSPEGLMIGGYEPLKNPMLSEPTIIKKYLRNADTANNKNEMDDKKELDNNKEIDSKSKVDCEKETGSKNEKNNKSDMEDKKKWEYPAVLMFHGSNDELVPFSQSCELFEALKKNNIEAELYQIEGAHHGDRQFWSTQVLDRIAQFIISTTYSTDGNRES